ncbi:MAG: PEP-CTERM sorting domain-containing protein [Cyanobacteria bacterium]|nr:PEP-CTERM sorting domain-containing protein [Cyanobacteriota bacterium]MDA0867310.1 PEP-CTERM sorting domain-containing protein [Cyanobacteriota bacterium]
MLKKTLLAAGVAVVTMAVASVPASAFGGIPTPDPTPTKEVPEPMTVLGILTVGGCMVAQKMAGARK